MSGVGQLADEDLRKAKAQVSILGSVFYSNRAHISVRLGRVEVAIETLKDLSEITFADALRELRRVATDLESQLSQWSQAGDSMNDISACFDRAAMRSFMDVVDNDTDGVVIDGEGAVIK